MLNHLIKNRQAEANPQLQSPQPLQLNKAANPLLQSPQPLQLNKAASQKKVDKSGNADGNLNHRVQLLNQFKP